MARQAKSRAKPLREGSAPTAHEGNTGIQTRSRARLPQQEGSVMANTDSRALGNKRQLGQTVPSDHISKKSKKAEEEETLRKRTEEEALEKNKKEEEALRKNEQEGALRKQAEEEPDRQRAEGAEGVETGGQVTTTSEMEVGNGQEGKSQAQTRMRAAGKKKAGKQTARNMANEEDEEQEGPDAEGSNNTNKQAPPEEYHEIPCCNCARDAADGNKTICTIVRSSKVAEKDGKQGIKAGKRGKILASCKNCIAKKLTCQLIKWNRDLEDAGKAIQSTMIEKVRDPLAEKPSGWPKWTAVVRDKVPRSNPTPAQISSDLTDHKSASNQRIIELEDRVKALEEQNSRMAATIQAIEGRLGPVGEQHPQGYDADGSMNRHTPGYGQPSSFQYPAPGGAGGW
ncbi:uncharacterized protein NECHADRAFT_89472 [Fusarium vanettenii 77-13-4]|uniref:Uncharacterized protein n=1 Tax=Fusarium vanettenii (strain ATCC MYA-4622 / CBS 123669 / FGSC 9596 / NRRL 45880 / 77-13-4) TaxID=660122 RepID=C7ZRA4_FUSV7|nr:uncharacterized protein NECHADRAFT_89472 [Fusarium vanettenii 77-13-4]EEU33455.1 predicted protein [Fusarium vanettenii 77-13-4]